MPLSIISDHGTQFISKFWEKLHEELGIQFIFSITFHPQTDEQSERTIQVLEEMLNILYHRLWVVLGQASTIV